MLKPRVPGYHGNQIKRRISSESRNLNYSDSFMEGKMKIPFTVQRALHCKGRRRKDRGGRKKKRIMPLFFCIWPCTSKPYPMRLKFIGCLMTAGMLTLSICAQRNDVTAVSPKLQINLLPLKRRHNMCVCKSSAKATARMMKSISCMHGIRCDCFLVW